LICLGLVSSISAMMWIGPRVTMVMGEDFRMLRIFAHKSKYGVPSFAIGFQLAVANLLLLAQSFEAVLEFIQFSLTLCSFFHGAGRDCAPLHQAGASTAISHLGLSGDADYLLIGDVPHDGLLAHQPSSAIAGGRLSDACRSHRLRYRPVLPGCACSAKSHNNKVN
jgi:hypothetical protein